jgi:hypothetical protein
MEADRSARRTGLPRKALAGGAVAAATVTAYLTLLNTGHDTWNWIFANGSSSPTPPATTSNRPEETRAVISNLAIRPATLEQYLHRLGEPISPAMYSQAKLHEHGLFVYPSLRIVGYRGQTLRFGVHVFDAASDRQVAMKQQMLQADTDDDTGTLSRWFPWSRPGHRFYAEYVVSIRRHGTWQDLDHKTSPPSPPT